MSADELKTKVLEVVRGFCSKLDAIDEDTLLECDLGLDYLDTVELVIEIEETLGIDFEDDAGEHVKTVGDLVREAQKQRVTDTVEDDDLVK